jgi:uncharacterized protein YjdB
MYRNAQGQFIWGYTTPGCKTGRKNMKKYEISYTSDIWETVIIEANSKKEAEDLFNQGEHYEQGHDPIEQGKENLKIESVEEVDPDTERPIKKDK